VRAILPDGGWAAQCPAAGQGITLRGMNTPPTALELSKAACEVAHAYAAYAATAAAIAAMTAAAHAAAASSKYAAEAAAMYKRAKGGALECELEEEEEEE